MPAPAPLACVVMDLDGSVLEPDESLPEDLAALVRERRDVRWVIATGRGHASAMATPPALLVDPATPHVCDGGALVATRGGHVVTEVRLTPDQVRDVLVGVDPRTAGRVFASTGLGSRLLWTADAAPVTGAGARSTTTVADFAAFTERATAAPVTKLTLRADAAPDLPQGVTAAVNGGVVDVTAAGVDKGSGVEVVLDRLGVAPHRAVFVFNDLNDLPVLSRASLTGVHRLKVGDLLPSTPADTSVPGPSAVAAALTGLLGPR